MDNGRIFRSRFHFSFRPWTIQVRSLHLQVPHVDDDTNAVAVLLHRLKRRVHPA